MAFKTWQISCDKCNRYISVVNLQPGQEAKCWYCDNRQTVPGNTINIQVIKYCKECDREYSNDDEFKYCNKDGKKLFTKEKRIENTPEPVRKGVRKTDNKKLSNRSTNTITPSLFAGAFAYVITNKLIDDEINGWWGVFAAVTVSTLVKILLDQVGVKDQFGDD